MQSRFLVMEWKKMKQGTVELPNNDFFCVIIRNWSRNKITNEDVKMVTSSVGHIMLLAAD